MREFWIIFFTILGLGYLAAVTWYLYCPPYRGRHRSPDDPAKFNYKSHYWRDHGSD